MGSRAVLVCVEWEDASSREVNVYRIEKGGAEQRRTRGERIVLFSTISSSIYRLEVMRRGVRQSSVVIVVRTREIKI